MYIELQPIPDSEGDKCKARLFNLSMVRTIMPLDKNTTRLYYSTFMDFDDVEISFTSLSMRLVELGILQT